jgi:hypothetical protein
MIQQEVVEEVLDSIEFEDYIKLEAEKFRQTEAYALLDKEFNVDYKRKVNELRKQYVKIDTGRVQDYCLILTGNDEDVKKFCSGLTNEGLNFFNLKDVVFIFFDYILELQKKNKILSLLNNHFNTKLEIHFRDILIRSLFIGDTLKKDLLGFKSIPTNLVFMVEKADKSLSYVIEKSEKRIFLRGNT